MTVQQLKWYDVSCDASSKAALKVESTFQRVSRQCQEISSCQTIGMKLQCLDASLTFAKPSYFLAKQNIAFAKYSAVAVELEDRASWCGFAWWLI